LDDVKLHFKKLWLSIGWGMIITIIVLSLTPPQPVMQIIEHADKIGHFIAYFAVMAWFAQIYHTNRFYSVLGLILLGLGIEILQGMTSNRHFSWLDLLTNFIGISLAWQITKNKLARILISLENFFVQNKI